MSDKPNEAPTPRTWSRPPPLIYAARSLSGLLAKACSAAAFGRARSRGRSFAAARRGLLLVLSSLRQHARRGTDVRPHKPRAASSSKVLPLHAQPDLPGLHAVLLRHHRPRQLASVRLLLPFVLS